MAVQRKCSQCATWNNDEDYCVNCGNVLSPQLIEVEKEKVRKKRRESALPSKLDVFIDHWKGSKYWVFRALYQLLYSVAVIFFSIGAFFAWLVTGAYG